MRISHLKMRIIRAKSSILPWCSGGFFWCSIMGRKLPSFQIILFIILPQPPNFVLSQKDTAAFPQRLVRKVSRAQHMKSLQILHLIKTNGTFDVSVQCLPYICPAFREAPLKLSPRQLGHWPCIGGFWGFVGVGSPRLVRYRAPYGICSSLTSSAWMNWYDCEQSRVSDEV